MRQTYPMYISQYDGFDSTVQILKNRQLLFEAPKKAFSNMKVYDDRPALTYSLDALDRGIRIELQTMGIDMAAQTVKGEEFKQAEKKAKDNLEKDANHYLNLMAGESNKVDKHDKEKEVKRGAADKDTFNDMKKATLKENMYIDDEEWEKEMGRSPEDTEKAIDKETSKMSEDAKKNLLGKVVGALRTKYPEITADIIKDFIKTHYQDLLDGADIEGEFEEYIYANYETASDFREGEEEEVELNTDADFEREQRNQLAGRTEAKGKDHDGDGDIDGDDYMAAKDKAIKKAMGKDESYTMKRIQRAHTQDRLAGKKSTYDIAKEKNKEQEKQLKEAIKSIIKKTLNEDVINEAATVKLADWAESYETFPGVKPVVNELENIVTEIETFYDKMADKIKNVFEKTSGFENEEGLKIGGFIAPGLESAFRQDLSKVIKKGSFFSKINLPKVRTITQADVDAHNSGERPLGETEIIEEPKDTVFTPNF